MDQLHNQIQTLVSQIQAVIPLMPGIAYFKDSSYRYQAFSQSLLSKLNLQQHELRGMTDFDLPGEHKHNADTYRAQDLLLAKDTEIRVIYVQQYPQDATRKVYCCIKKPVYFEDEFIGILGHTVELEHQQIQTLVQHGAITKTCQCNQFQRNALAVAKTAHDKLSPRESACLFYLMRGRTAKEIAQKLNISAKTAESYIARIKVKLNCFSKSQLIDKAYALQLDKFLPEALITQTLHTQETQG